MAKGKLLVLQNENHILTLLMKDNRLLAANACKTEYSDDISLVGNIYVGKVQNIVKNIEAAFVEITKGVLCFLPLSDLEHPIITNRPNFDDILKVGDELLVQVSRDAQKTKQATVTTKLSISGQYVALSNGSKKLGVSNKLGKEQKKHFIEELTSKGLLDEKKNCVQAEVLSVPYGMVIRTNAGTLTDISPLIEEWRRLEKQFIDMMSVSLYRPYFTCLKKNPPSYLTGLKDFYREEYEEIVTEDKALYEEIAGYLTNVPVRLYQDALLPLAKLYSVESRLDTALNRRVWLKSGGYLVIEPTEALTVIDVNTGKYEARKEKSMNTFHKINMEAADEIAIQLRLRNLSGIIVVDFINTDSKDMQNELLSTLRQLVRKDSIRTDVVDITPLGLVEITRKKINKPLKEQLQ